MLAQVATLLLAAGMASAAAVAPRQAISSYSKSPIAWSFPEGRGFAVESADTAPCGGIAPGNRTPYPLGGGNLAFSQSAPNLSNVNVLYTNETNPTRFHQFKRYAGSLTDLGAGHYCPESPDFGSLGFKAGDDATLLVIFQLGDESTYYYQCADVNLIETSTFVEPTGIVCGNYSSTFEVATKEEEVGGSQYDGGHPAVNGSAVSIAGVPASTASVSTDTAGSGSDSGSSSSSDSGMSAAAGGGIGAGVTIVVIALIAAVAAFTGLISFGKKKASVRDDSSTSSSVPVMKQARV